MKNKLKYVCAGILPLLGTADAASAIENMKEQGERPNILFILSDDHTSQTWGIYGGILADYAQNENIRRLANEGVVLEDSGKLAEKYLLSILDTA